MSGDKRLEEFEAWATNNRYSTKTDSLGYCHPETTRAWRLWQDSRAALVIELPDRYDHKYWIEEDGCEGQYFDYPVYFQDCCAAIEASGAKVAP